MKIRHVITLVSEDRAFGGPFTVAMAQLTRLAAGGDDVALVSLWRGAGRAPATFDGIPLRTRKAHRLPGTRGFIGLVNPLLLVDVWKEARSSDVLHVHAGRDLVSLTALVAAVLSRRPFVVQTHGMIEPRAGRLHRLFDLVYMPLLRRASRLLLLTEQEVGWVREVLGSVPPPPVELLPNGVEVPAEPADFRGDGRTVMYVGRIADDKRPQVFVEAAALVHEAVPDARFVMYGPAQEALRDVRAAIDRLGLAGVVSYEGPLSHADTLVTIRSADLNVMPSMVESFGMSLLEGMAAGVAAVCTEGLAISRDLADAGAAVVTDGSARDIADAVVELLRDPAKRHELARRGREEVGRSYSLDLAVERLVGVYRQVAAGAPPVSAAGLTGPEGSS